MVRCKNGTRKNKHKVCVPIKKNKSVNSKTRKTPSDEWNSEADKEFKEILK